ncbi:MAG: hypothetical protein P4L83_12715 [Nevskia sp.]|nr:hypothetical protein [Nevskia sp.]
MIRYHDAQDFLSAEVTPMHMHSAAGTTAIPHTAALSAYTTVQNSHGDYGAASYPFVVYAAALPVLVLFVVVVIALLSSLSGRKGAVEPRRAPGAYGDPAGVSSRRRPLPAVVAAGRLPVHRANRRT